MDDIEIQAKITATDDGVSIHYFGYIININDGSTFPYQLNKNGEWIESFMDFRQAIDYINEVQ